jgi:hypothetical protein
MAVPTGGRSDGNNGFILVVNGHRRQWCWRVDFATVGQRALQLCGRRFDLTKRWQSCDEWRVDLAAERRGPDVFERYFADNAGRLIESVVSGSLRLTSGSIRVGHISSQNVSTVV